MDRSEALDYVRPYADTLFLAVKMTLDDTTTGYSPALDGMYATLGLVLDSEIPETPAVAARPVLRALSYDLVLARAAALVDFQVDAPLTNIKLSQLFKQVHILRDAAWAEASVLGYGPSNVAAHRWNLDFREPFESTGGDGNEWLQ